MSNSSQKHKGSTPYKNPLEAIKDFGSSTVKNAASDMKKMGTGIFDQFFGGSMYENSSLENKWSGMEKAPQAKPKREFNLFNYQQYYEKDLIKREIKQLSEIIKQELAAIKKADSALLNDIRDVEKIALDSLPEAPGIYHVHFLEIVISLLRTIRAKIGESRTWLQAMVSKRKKRGSLFAVLSKKKGTQYSLSQELSSSRSVQ